MPMNIQFTQVEGGNAFCAAKDARSGMLIGQRAASAETQSERELVRPTSLREDSLAALIRVLERQLSADVTTTEEAETVDSCVVCHPIRRVRRAEPTAVALVCVDG